MTKTFNLLIFCFFIGSFLSNAQSLTQTKEELTQLLCKRWDINYAKIGEMKIEQMPGASDFDILFDKDGTYEIINADGEANKGKWTYYPKKQFVQMEINDRQTLRVIDISENKLICTSTPGTDGPPMNTEIHFKLIN